jgi:FMNH2-dependent dimethyl sulfone monooxygenase
MRMLTCTWAPTVFDPPKWLGQTRPRRSPEAAALRQAALGRVRRIEDLGISHLLVAQRWWGSAEEIEASSLDCLAMTALFAAHTERIQLVTAVHPGFFRPTTIAKWGATMDWITGGRWSINVTSGWHLKEFEMYGVDPLEHDERYVRSSEFIDVLRGAWGNEEFSFDGKYYQARGLRLEPRPSGSLTVYQGGQSDAAIAMAARHSDWMFLNGGSPEKIAGIIGKVRGATAESGRNVRFAMHAHPLCRATDAEAWEEIEQRIAAVDPRLLEARRRTTSGAEGMWASADDVLGHLDTNEGYSAGLVGSPESVMERIETYRELGVEMLHLTLGDRLFEEMLLPELTGVAQS